MSTPSIRQLTPDDRYWRIDWFGEFGYPPGPRHSQPSIRVAFSPVLCDPEDSNAMLAANATSLNNQRQVWLIPLPHLVDEHGVINPVAFCADDHGGERERRGCFVEIKEGKKSHCQIFIVERDDIEDVVKAINVRDFDLRRAMEMLIEESCITAQPDIGNLEAG